MHFPFERRVVSSGAGRPNIEFSESSERSKRRKTQELRENVPLEELTYATQMSLRASGNTAAAEIVKDISKIPSQAGVFQKALKEIETPSAKKHSPSEALALFIEADLTKKQWELLHASNKTLYPCYSTLKNAKGQCYPDEQYISVTENSFEVKLQGLLNHTSSRLSLYIDEILTTLTKPEQQNLEMYYKWGCDGSQQDKFKQKFENAENSDSNVFMSSLVPVRLFLNIEGNQKLLWQNPSPSSPRFCRPIRARFIRETNETTKEEINYIEKQIGELTKSEYITTDSNIVLIKHTLFPTMVDGKVCNAATETSSSMRCYICQATSKTFNNLDKRNEENPASFKFGMSPLHLRIRCFETILHLSYKLPLKTWQARTTEEKKVVSDRKAEIQSKMKEELGLLVDIPKAGSGNTARRFFENVDIVSKITGVDKTLIYRFKVIIETVTSGHSVDLNLFAAYTEETARKYVSKYNWYPMTPTVHKLLIHGKTIMEHALLPIGQLSEEAAEARNKHFRDYRQNFARKFSRTQCNKDVLNRLLLSSDPFFSSSRKIPVKKSEPFCPETLHMLKVDNMVDLQEIEGADETLDNSD
ncbi:uncharacterized protein LOC110677210 [Aedes aegypti]|uniref:Uncharacterized protein n=1 Tax=Aedes aegypti TaxID=7159 RepID=A0A6I8U6G5_AEDAE|nr:uncharacterized protein LOC110677210 [Aedes aegypti]